MSSNDSSVGFSSAGRNQTLDAVRGVALGGIFLVNIQSHLSPPGGGIDALSAVLVELLAVSKFYPLFALLFGIGVALQLRQSDQATPWMRCASRLMSLYLIGLTLFVFIDSNYILISYASLGFLLLAGRAISANGLLVIALAGLSLSVTYPAVTRFISAPGALVQNVAAMANASRATTSQERPRTGRHRTYGQWVQARAHLYWTSWTTTPTVTLYHIVSLLFGGMFLVRRGTVDHARLFQDATRLRRSAGWLWLIGLLAIGVSRWWMPSRDDLISQVTDRGVSVVGTTTLALGYAMTIAAVVKSGRARICMDWIASAGRMALTHFISQSLVIATVFHSYGLGLEGQIGAAMGCGFALLVWMAQVSISPVWLRFFGIGPVESIWRFLAYGAPKAAQRPAMA
jgi:uncharacterized protein